MEERHSRPASGIALSVPAGLGGSTVCVDGRDNRRQHRQDEHDYCHGTEEKNNRGELVTPILVVSAAGENYHDLIRSKAGNDYGSNGDRYGIRTSSDSNRIPFMDDMERRKALQRERVTDHHRSASTGSDTPFLEKSVPGSRDRPTSFTTLSATAYDPLRGSYELRDEQYRQRDLMLPVSPTSHHEDEESCL